MFNEMQYNDRDILNVSATGIFSKIILYSDTYTKALVSHHSMATVSWFEKSCRYRDSAMFQDSVLPLPLSGLLVGPYSSKNPKAHNQAGCCGCHDHCSYD